jgi:hypothetical protein
MRGYEVSKASFRANRQDPVQHHGFAHSRSRPLPALLKPVSLHDGPQRGQDFPHLLSRDALSIKQGLRIFQKHLLYVSDHRLMLPYLKHLENLGSEITYSVASRMTLSHS